LLRIGGGHKIRKNLFLQGIRDGFLNVEEVEEILPDGLMTAAERWLLYFSLRAAGVELRDRHGSIVTPDDLVPEHRRRRRAARDATVEYSDALDRTLEDQLL
jgi:hypothetical protein